MKNYIFYPSHFTLLLPVFLIITIAQGCNFYNPLQEKTETLEARYIAWGCNCAPWISASDVEKYGDAEDALAEKCFFIEPDNPTLKLPDTLGYNGDRILFIGKFYARKGYPENFGTKEGSEPARVLRYTSYKIIKSNFEPNPKEL